MHANEASVDQISDFAATEITVIGDGEAAVDCASALALLRRGHNMKLIMSTCGTIPHSGSETSSAAAATTGPVVTGASLLEESRRRALHAALQPHPSLPPPGAVDRVLRAPTKRRFWAYVKGRAAAAAVSLSGGCGAAAGGDFVNSSIRTVGTSSASPTPAQQTRLVLWAPSFRDPRVMPFLEPDLRRALLLQGDTQQSSDHLVLYRGVVHPDVPGLAFVGWKAHAATPLLVLELQAQWLVALLTARLQLPPIADMYDDMARQRAWRAAALASPLMSARGSLARTHDGHYIRQLLTDLTDIVELRKQRWEPASAGYASGRTLPGGQSPISACDGRPRLGGLGACFGAATAAGTGTVKPIGMRHTQAGESANSRYDNAVQEVFAVTSLVPTTQPVFRRDAPRPAFSFQRNSGGEPLQTTGQSSLRPPVSPAAAAAAAGAEEQGAEPIISKRHPLPGVRQLSPTCPTPNRHASGVAIGCNGSSASAVAGGSGFRVKMYIHSPPMAPYLQEKLRRAVQFPAVRMTDISGRDGGLGGPRVCTLWASHNPQCGTASQDASATEYDLTAYTRDHRRRHRVNGSDISCSVRQLLYPIFSDARGCDVDGGAGGNGGVPFGSTSPVVTAAAAAVTSTTALSSIVGRSCGSTYVSGGRLSRGSAGEETREADLSARLRRMSQSAGVDISTLVDIVADDGGYAGTAAGLYGSQILLPLPPTVVNGTLLKAQGSAYGGAATSSASGRGGCAGDGFQQQRRPLPCHTLESYPHITEVAGVPAKAMYGTDLCDGAMVAGQLNATTVQDVQVPAGICVSTSGVSDDGDRAVKGYLSHAAMAADLDRDTAVGTAAVSEVKVADQSEALDASNLPPPSPFLSHNVALDANQQFPTTADSRLRPQRQPRPPVTPPPPPPFQLPKQPTQPQYPWSVPGMGFGGIDTRDAAGVRLYDSHIRENQSIGRDNGDGGENGDSDGDSDSFTDPDDIILTLRRLVNVSGTHGNGSGNDRGSADVSDVDVDGEDCSPGLGFHHHAAVGITGDERKLDSGVTLACPVSPHTAPLQPPQLPRDRQSWSPPVRPHLQPSAPRLLHAQITAAAAAAAAATVVARTGATAATPYSRLSAPEASMLESPLLTAPAPAPASASASASSSLGRRLWWVTPPWAPPSRQASGIEAGQDVTSNPTYTNWLRSAAASIMTRESARRRESCPGGYSYSPGGNSYIPGGYSYSPGCYSYSPGGNNDSPGGYSCSYNPMDVNEALMEAACWSSSRQSLLQLPAAAFTVASAAGTSRSMGPQGEHQYRQLRARRDTADGSGLSGCTHRQRGNTTTQEGSELSVSGRAAAGVDVAYGGRGSCATPEMVGAEAGDTSVETGVVCEGGIPGGNGSGNEGGGMVAQRPRCSLLERSGPLTAVGHQGPAWSVRHEIQERHDRIVREISCWLREALERKAQAQMDSAAGAGAGGVIITGERTKPPQHWQW
ncbi:hypothetical protein Vretimale_8720 [Volvox reticuliferus]|nr:hypothetical protein Vretimale_8720 [Volvox reticuliferus]